jgi:hypothetical protein
MYKSVHNRKKAVCYSLEQSNDMHESEWVYTDGNKAKIVIKIFSPTY